MNRRMLEVAGALAVLSLSATALGFHHTHPVSQPVQEIALVSGGPNPPQAPRFDENLVNAWGLVVADDLVWVANNGSGTATVYDTGGAPFPANHPIVINVNGHETRNGAPTGIVKNPDGGFFIRRNFVVRPSTLLFAGEDGTVAGWNRDVDRDDALVRIDNNGSAIYKGLTLAVDGGNQRFLYVADFGVDGPGSIEVYNSAFHFVGSFTDDDPPPVPEEAGDGAVFTPFNVININNLLVVTFAVKMPGEGDEIHCDGCGFVDIFAPNGVKLARVARNRQEVFNAPWGVSLAPVQFGGFSDALLIGNFGSGLIDAFNPFTLQFLGQLTDKQGDPLVIDGLWGIDRGKTSCTADELFFASGPNDEEDGLLGKLVPDP